MNTLEKILLLFGIDARKAFRAVTNSPKFISDYLELRKQISAEGEPEFNITKFYPVLGEQGEESGTASGHYFHQDLYVARRIYDGKPGRHIDVASRVDGFVSHVAVFREIDVADIRHLSTTAKNINFLQCNLMDKHSVNLLGSSDSVSCLHSIEHFGLGRYGDPVALGGYIQGLENLCLLVSPGGVLYLSVPIGPQRIEFNAHRVFSVQTIIDLVPADFQIERFSYVDDLGEMHENVDLSPENLSSSFGCRMGCGIYEFRKRALAQ